MAIKIQVMTDEAEGIHTHSLHLHQRQAPHYLRRSELKFFTLLSMKTERSSNRGRLFICAVKNFNCMICGFGFLLQALRSYDASTRPFVCAVVAERCGKSEQKASELSDEDC